MLAGFTPIMAKKLNWGIITTGWIARKFVTDLLQSQTGRFVAVGVVGDEVRGAGERAGCRRFS